MKYYVYDLWTYDIIGNPKDGYDVNNRIKEESGIVLSEDIVMSDELLIGTMKDINLISPDVPNNDIYIDGEVDGVIFFSCVSEDVGYLPLFELACTNTGEVQI